MTNKEALDKITNLAVTYSQVDADTCELFTIAKKAIEKQTSKRPNIEHQPICALYRCPICNKLLIVYYPGADLITGEETEFCDHCGQRLDWSEEK